MARHVVGYLAIVAILCSACREDSSVPDGDAASDVDAMTAEDGGTDAAAPSGLDAGTELDASADLDAGRTERVDAGSTAPTDGGPEEDAYTPPLDAGSTEPPLDAGARVDAAVPSADAGLRGCGCERSASCSDLGPYACGPGFAIACSGGTRVSACERDTALYWCEGPFEGVTYYYRYQGNSAMLEQTCVSGGHTFVARTPPSPSGEACSCRRSAGACVETYGASCASLSCDALELAPCDGTGATSGRCVSFDGDLRVTFYGASRSEAERACRDLGSELYWVP